MKKIIFIFFIFFTNILALEISSYKVKNGTTALLFINKKNINDVKLTFENQNINFFKNPFKENSFYALLPITYYQKLGKFRIIASYLQNNKRVFEGIDLQVIDGEYESEVINVKPSKLKPPKDLEIKTKKEYEEAIKIYNTTTNEIYWDSEFILPLNSKITSNFGTKRVYNQQIKSYHSGTDFKAPDNTPIYATNSGIVKLAKDRFYAGKSLIIDHGNGVYSSYFHLNKINFKVGDFVKKGEIIALSGSTGRITGPHLHFAFRINGIQVDPLDAIKILNKLKNNI